MTGQPSETAARTMTDDEIVEKIAVALLNDDRTAAGWPPVTSRDKIPDSDGYVRNARALLPLITQLRGSGWQGIDQIKIAPNRVHGGSKVTVDFYDTDAAGKFFAALQAQITPPAQEGRA